MGAHSSAVWNWIRSVWLTKIPLGSRGNNNEFQCFFHMRPTQANPMNSATFLTMMIRGYPTISEVIGHGIKENWPWLAMGQMAWSHG